MSQLDALPPEILFNILAFTEPSCNPTLVSYSLNALAETNKQLHAIVEEYARGLLKQHAGFTAPKSSKTFVCRRKWLGGLCQLCKKSSKRKAILYPTVTCYRLCDTTHFPKMTMTKATSEYYLSKLDLFTPNILYPHLPPLAVGAYAVMGGTATMISEADVIARHAYLQTFFGERALHPGYLRKHSACHNRIIQHMSAVPNPHGKWVARPEKKTLSSSVPKSMRTEESRKAYIEKALQQQWEEMGITQVGRTQDTAIELD